tara:strand:+ start:20369 stop:20665 length:297 start_codon:yes stop_codon:yes gene_type:complete
MFVDMFSYLCVYDDDELVSVLINLKPVNECYQETFEKVRSSPKPDNVLLTYTDAQQPHGGIQTVLQLIDGKTDKITLINRDAHDMLKAHPEMFETDED